MMFLLTGIRIDSQGCSISLHQPGWEERTDDRGSDTRQWISERQHHHRLWKQNCCMSGVVGFGCFGWMSCGGVRFQAWCWFWQVHFLPSMPEYKSVALFRNRFRRVFPMLLTDVSPALCFWDDLSFSFCVGLQVTGSLCMSMAVLLTFLK